MEPTDRGSETRSNGERKGRIADFHSPRDLVTHQLEARECRGTQERRRRQKYGQHLSRDDVRTSVLRRQSLIFVALDVVLRK